MAMTTHQINLNEMPRIFQVGLNEHGIVKNETFIMKKLWSLHLYRWKGQLQVDANTFKIAPGCISLCPPNIPLKWIYVSKNAMHYYVHFYLPKPNGNEVHFPIFSDKHELMTKNSNVLESIIKDFKSNPPKANIKFWDFLWELTVTPKQIQVDTHQLPFALQTLTSIIHNELETSLPIKSLAHRVGISHVHLLRLFKCQFKMTISEYIRKYRIDHATELLLQTSLPIKAIATEVGILNLQQFNKLFKRFQKISPSKYRIKNQKN